MKAIAGTSSARQAFFRYIFVATKRYIIYFDYDTIENYIELTLFKSLSYMDVSFLPRPPTLVCAKSQLIFVTIYNFSHNGRWGQDGPDYPFYRIF